MLAQSIIGTAFGAATVRPPGPPTVSGTFYWNDNLNTYYYLGGTYADSVTQVGVTYADSTTGNTLRYDGTGYEMTPTLGAVDNFWLDIWIYPISNTTGVLTETGQGNEGGYTYNMIEIDGSNYVRAGIWTGYTIDYVTSPNQVTLNAWNHLFFYHYNGVIHLQVNGGTAAEMGGLTRSAPAASFISVGGLGGSNMGNSARFNGYAEPLYGWNDAHASRYEDTKAKYQAQPVFALQGSSYTSGNWVDSIASKSFTLYGSPTWSGTNGGQFRFDKNSSQYAECSSSLTSLSNFTLQGVFKIHSTSTLASCLITEKWPAVSHINYAIGLINSTGSIDAGFFNLNGGLWNTATGITSPSNDTWYDLVMTYNGTSKELKTYLNGTLVSTVTTVGTAASDNAGIRIARRWDTTDYFDCTVKDINIWNGIMTPAEVAKQHTSYNSLV